MKYHFKTKDKEILSLIMAQLTMKTLQVSISRYSTLLLQPPDSFANSVRVYVNILKVSDQMFKRSGTEEDEPEVTIIKILLKNYFQKTKT